MRDVVLFGGRGGGTIAAQMVRRAAAAGQPIRLRGFLNDLAGAGEIIAGVPVLGGFDSWRDLPGDMLFLAALPKAKEMQRRAARLRGLKIPEPRWATIIDPAAFIADDAAIGSGACIGPFAVVDTEVRIGRHVVLWPAAQIGHESVLGDFVYVGRGSVVSGRCTIDEGAHIGPRAVLIEGCRVGRYAVVGAGAVVIRNVPDHAIVAGNPAKIIGQLDPKDDPA
jgi:acetyltransferase EpsM